MHVPVFVESSWGLRLGGLSDRPAEGSIIKTYGYTKGIPGMFQHTRYLVCFNRLTELCPGG